MSKFAEIIGRRIREARESQELTREQFAEIAKKDASYIKDIESGRYSITIDNLRKICKALNIKIVDLFKGY